jgi:DNA-binding response OmpR family regulator
MNRMLTIDDNRSRAQELAMECLEHGVAVRMAESVCEGVRYLLDAPASLVLVDAGVLRMAGPDQARLFDAVAPGVPVVLAVDAGARVEDRVAFELKGFHVVSRPFALPDLLAKVERPGKVVPARNGARAQVEVVCG